MVRSAPASRRAIRAIALVEAAKGALVLLAATALLSLIHVDLNRVAGELVRHSHLNPAAHYPHIFLDAVAHLDEPRLLWLAAGAAGYSLLRFAEAWGLYRERAWAEWLAAASGAIYLPVEVDELMRGVTAIGAGVFAINLAIVALMARALLQRRRAAGH